MIGDANYISVIELLEDITAASFPLLMPKLSIVWNVFRGQEDPPQFAGSITVFLDNEQLISHDVSGDFGSTFNHRQTLVLGNFIVTHPGTVHVRFTIPNGSVTTYSFTVRGAPPQVNPAPATQAAG